VDRGRIRDDCVGLCVPRLFFLKRIGLQRSIVSNIKMEYITHEIPDKGMFLSENEKNLLRICSIACVLILIAGYVIFFIFACMSLTKTDVDAVYAVCGHSLRVIVLVDVLFGSIVIILCFSVVAIVTDCVKFRCYPRMAVEDIAWITFPIAAVL
jgi:hypothetical protein